MLRKRQGNATRFVAPDGEHLATVCWRIVGVVYVARMPIELSTGAFSADEAAAVGEFLLEMAVLERAVDRALLDQYAADEMRDLFIGMFMKRMTLGPKIRALIAAAKAAGDDVISATETAHLAGQLDELVKVRNQVAHESPSFEYYLEHIEPYFDGEEWVEADVDSRASYKDLEVTDLRQLTQQSRDARDTIGVRLHRPLMIHDPNNDNIVQ